MTALLDQLKEIVGPRGWTTDADELQPHLTEWRGNFEGRTPIMVRPKSTSEVCAIIKACAAAGVAIVPQGGNTGMCAAGIPDDSGEQVLLSLSRMNRVLEVDAENFSMVVEAGVILADAQEAARAAGRFFPLSLGAEGSCQVGGNIATNAGGINVGRYGTARSLVLGLEVVLADGTVLDVLRSLRKDTAGYDVKQIFVGSEGTLGIITKASLRLFPDPGNTSTALLGLAGASAAVDVLGNLKDALDDRVESFELVSARVFGLVEKHIEGARLPFDEPYPWYVLVESAAGDDSELLEQALAVELEQGRVLDAVIAKSKSEADALWRLRHSIAEAERQDGKALKHDVSVPLSKMQTFLEQGDRLLAELRPDLKLVAFGHVGDGNLHYNLTVPPSLAGDASRVERLTTSIYELVEELGGSFSAEHGVGVTKRAYLDRYRGAVEVELMRRLKKSLDPQGLLNPGKVI